jgi:hypothetical protein
VLEHSPPGETDCAKQHSSQVAGNQCHEGESLPDLPFAAAVEIEKITG